MRISMLDVEVLYHGTGRQTGVTDLRDGRKLPIWFSARDIYVVDGVVGAGAGVGVL